MNTDDIHGLSGAYAVDAVDGVEWARFDSHLAGCEACRNEVVGLRAAATELSRCSATAPSPWLRTSILRDITSIRPLPPLATPQTTPEPDRDTASAPSGSASSGSASSGRVAPVALANLDSKRAERARLTVKPRQWLVGVAAAAVLAAGGVAWHPFSSGTNTSTSTPQLTAMEQVLQAKDGKRYTKSFGGASATIVRSSSLAKAVIVTADMPPPPPGKVYELWFQQGRKMVRAGLLPSGQANSTLLDGDASTARAVGITVEPAGGSAVPTALPVAMIALV